VVQDSIAQTTSASPSRQQLRARKKLVILMHRQFKFVIIGFIFLALSACADKAAMEPSSPQPKVQESKELVIYSGRGQVLIQKLVDDFEAESGIKVNVRYEKSTQALASRLLSEKDQTQADVFFAQDSGYLGALAQKGVLEKLPENVLTTVEDYNRDSNGFWVATSGRARVLVFDPRKYQESDLPDSLAELTNPKYAGIVGWAPSNASFQAHVSALRHLWGEEKTKSWLENMAKIQPRVYPKNSPQVRGVSSGEIGIGWVNHYYLHKLQASDPKLEAKNYSFRAEGDAGNLMMLSGVGVVKGAKNKDAALQFVNYLLSPKVQERFTRELYEYPTHPKVKAHSDLPAIATRMVRVDQQHLADVGPTLELLRQLKLQ
jgi:iron(III) transport system substrate-binding protein